MSGIVEGVGRQTEERRQKKSVATRQQCVGKKSWQHLVLQRTFIDVSA